jgi:hypothetical protein
MCLFHFISPTRWGSNVRRSFHSSVLFRHDIFDILLENGLHRWLPSPLSVNRRCTWCCPFSGPTSASPHRNRPNDTRLKYVDFFCGPPGSLLSLPPPPPALQSVMCLDSTICPPVILPIIFHVIFHQFHQQKHIHIHIMVHQSHIRCSQLFSIHILFSCPESCSTNRRLSSFCVPLDSLLVRPSPSETKWNVGETVRLQVASGSWAALERNIFVFVALATGLWELVGVGPACPQKWRHEPLHVLSCEGIWTEAAVKLHAQEVRTWLMTHTTVRIHWDSWKSWKYCKY